MVIVDASVWIDWDHKTANPQTAWLRGSGRVEDIGLTDLILCEVLRRCRSDGHARRLRAEMLPFPVLTGGSAAIAEEAARYYREIRNRGITVASTVDCLTAAFCLSRGHRLLHRDGDYDAFEKQFGLAVVHPQGGRA